MAVGHLITGGLGNGTMTTTIPLVVLRGLGTATAAVTVTDVRISELLRAATIRGSLRHALVAESLRTATIEER